MKLFRTWKWGFFVRLSKNKGIEYEIFWDKHLYKWFNFQFDISRKCDHAGILFDLQLLWLNLTINFFDFRHWDYDENCWDND